MLEEIEMDDEPIRKGRFWLFPDGTRVPVVSGGMGDPSDDDPDDDDEDPDDDDEDEDEDDSKKKKPRTFTQDQVNRVASKEKREGKRAGVRELLDRFDIDDEDQLEKLLKKARQEPPKKKTNDSDTTESDAALAAAEQKAKEAQDEAKKVKHDAAVERRLLSADADPKKVEKLARMLDLPIGADNDEIDDAVDDLKEEFPNFFADESDEDDDDGEDDTNERRRPKRKTGPVSNRPGSQPKKKGGGDPAKAAQTRLQQRHGDRIQQLQNNRKGT